MKYENEGFFLSLLEIRVAWSQEKLAKELRELDI